MTYTKHIPQRSTPSCLNKENKLMCLQGLRWYRLLVWAMFTRYPMTFKNLTKPGELKRNGVVTWPLLLVSNASKGNSHVFFE
jgi:hypothetical protein